MSARRRVGARVAVTAVAGLLLAVASPQPEGGAAATREEPATPALTSSRIATDADFHPRRTLGTGLHDSTTGDTVVTWNGPGMRFEVRAFDERTRTWGPATTVAPALRDPDPNLFHDYGVLVLLPDGRYGIVAAHHTRSLHLVTALDPHSVAGDWSTSLISEDAPMYPVPVVAGSTLYVFYSSLMPSATGTYRTYRYLTRTYCRRTGTWSGWSDPVTVVDTGQTPDRLDEVYGYDAHLDPVARRLYLSWTMAGGPAGHNGQARDLYVAYLDLADRTVHAVGGASLGAAVDAAELAAVRVVDAAPAPTSVADYARRHPVQNPAVTVTRDGAVVVAFGDRTSRSVRVRRYVDGAWSTAVVDSPAHNFLDLRRTGGTLQVLYTRAGHPGTLVLAESTDGGATWPTTRTVDVDLTAVPGHTAPDGIAYANFVEDSPSGGVQAVGATVDWDHSKDHGTHWPVFAVRGHDGRGT